MANQINIDIGAAANDGTGDPLRTAFNYVNLNFANVWATGLPNSNVQFNNNRILTVNTNANLVLAPNGTGIVQSNVSILPNIDRVHSLGSAARRWYNVYSNYLDVNIVEVNGNLTVAGNLTVEGDTIQIGNIVTDTKTIQLSNTAVTANTANGSGITVGANDNIATMLYSGTSNTWTMNIGANIAGNVTAPYFIGNGALLTGITSYANANVVAYGQSGWAGNIIPAGNAVYSLGNATNQWNDLYVSNATIFMNNVPISLTAGNVLTVNSQPVLINDSNTSITTTGNITADFFIGDGSLLSNISGGNTGNIGFDNYNIYNTQGGGIIVSNFNYLTEEAETAWIEIPPGNSINELRVVQEQGNVLLVATDRVWTFGTDGNLTIPGTIVGQGTVVIDNRATGNSADINLFSADDITIQARDRTLGSSSEGGDINIFAGDSAEDGDSSGGDVTIEAGNGGAANVDFGGSGGFITIRAGNGGDASTQAGGQSAYGGGALTLRAGSAGSNMGNIARGSSGGDVSINAGESTGNNSSGGDIRLNTGTGGANALAGSLSINIPESSQSPGGSWVFDGTGKLTGPGSIQIGTGNTGVQLGSNPTGTGFYATIANITNGLPSVVVTLNDVEFVESDQGTVRITGVEGETQANGFWGWRAVEIDQIQLYTDDTFSTPVDGTTWSAYVSGGLAVSSGRNNLDIQGGNVAIISGAGKYWSFNPDGNLVLPQGGTISEGSSPSGLGDAVTITPANGTDADQQLKIYPTFAEGNHLHLTTGNLYNTEMYVGDDNLYVKLANTGDVVINSNDNQGNTAQWTFGTDGVLTLPSIQIPAEGPQGEAESLVGTRRLIGGVNSDYGYSRLLDNNSGSTIAWEATDDNTVSARITFNITYTNSSFTFQAREMLTIDVVQDLAEQQAYFSVSGRMGTNGYAPGVVSASIVGNKIQINIVPDGIYYYGLAVYDAVEFRNPLD